MANALPKLVPRSHPSDRATSPPPSTPHFPEPEPVASDHAYIIPIRRILSPDDHGKFQASPTYTLLTGFVFTTSDAVRGVPISALKAESLSPALSSILQVLDSVHELVKSNPPVDTAGSRFGNPAFPVFCSALSSSLSPLHESIPGLPSAAIPEVSTYLLHSFGSAERIDYGSGHELNFWLWLLCLSKLGVVPSDKETLQQLALRIFPQYLNVVRIIQLSYYLEPAGSHGVWGLDDYQFLPFLFGASQLIGHSYIRPKSVHQQLVLEECAKDYLYLDQIAFVNSTKNVEGLRWHSPMLDDISAAKSWEKIEGGMRKMFVREVLGKLPVMQHFLFGSLIPAVEGMTPAESEGGSGSAEHHHDHEHTHEQGENSWGDCCGIKVPGSVGAMQEARKQAGAQLRRIPFD
ncbi:Phosphotyrosyl phosphatase activator [Eremomyces bilateralis CBS 781.70]|uniref:Serine/threonine-protein phosphatase 2A activator n=1 Tax=Eremomyces bilateralis CBS 781.70 TaxID=1392243 RepID=A0A6G1GA79_9PEZI|nr:Phosphotyrosyl phosphatase activator [Eremomyces bilateralis CBS 781.70]KAF1814820.1 Phosphotyrosyl phosphatase activator [Eremomyces bilateralis CBS 781.70]